MPQTRGHADLTTPFEVLPPGVQEFTPYPGERIVGYTERPVVLPRIWVPPDRMIAEMCGIRSVKDPTGARMPIASRAMGRPIAGEGLFEGEFGRDALEMAETTLPIYPWIARATLIRLAELSGYEDRQTAAPPYDLMRDGAICHENREPGDPVREEYEGKYGWSYPYFGSIDATPLWLRLLRSYLEATNDWELLKHEVILTDGRTRRTMLEVAGKAAQCLAKRAQENPEHIMETGMASNLCWQVMADSPDAYYDELGGLAQNKLGTIEVQGYTYDGFCDAAWLAERVGPFDAERVGLRAGENREHAALTARAICGPAFFVPKGPHGPFFGHAIDRPDNGRPRTLRVSTVHQLDLLDTRLFDGMKPADREYFLGVLVNQGWNPDAGILVANGHRMTSGHSPRYRNDGYHYKIWPHKSFKAGRGAIRQGAFGLGLDTHRRMQLRLLALRCYAEMFRGDAHGPPRIESVIIDTISPTMRRDGSTYENRAVQPGQLGQGWVVCAARAAARQLGLAAQGRLPRSAVAQVAKTLEHDAFAKMEEHGVQREYDSRKLSGDRTMLPPNYVADAAAHRDEFGLDFSLTSVFN